MIMALFQKSLPGRIFNKLNLFFKKEKKWQDIEYFDDKWKERIEQMARFIKNGSSVIDLGCGPMWLKRIFTFRMQVYTS
ncbi:MAG: hypothetical protein IPO53_02690 [Chitinophagaceae bacterium]|nr:hypothetical protein [Chitinophagaceae bacterium]